MYLRFLFLDTSVMTSANISCNNNLSKFNACIDEIRWSNEFRHSWRVKRSHIPIAIIDLNNGKDIYVCTKKNSRRIVKLRNPVNPVQAVLNIVLRIVEFYTFLHLYLSLSLSLFEYSIIIIPFVSIAISLTFFSYLTYILVRNSC